MRKLDVFGHGEIFTTSTSSFSAENGEEAHREFTGFSLDLKARFVCTRCNNGWMSDLETEAEPILSRLMSDEAADLSPTDQAVIATWVTKTLLVVQFALPSTIADEMVEMRRELFARSEPLPGSRIWIARYGGDGRWPVVLHQHGLKFQSSKGDEEDFKLFDAVVAFGPLVFLFYGRFDLAALPMQTRGTTELRPIWPALADVRWPPPATIASEDELERHSRKTPDGNAAMINPRRLAEQPTGLAKPEPVS